MCVCVHTLCVGMYVYALHAYLPNPLLQKHNVTQVKILNEVQLA